MLSNSFACCEQHNHRVISPIIHACRGEPALPEPAAPGTNKVWDSMDFSFSAGTKASNGGKATSKGAATGGYPESPRLDSGFASPLFSPGAGSALHRKAGSLRRKAARSTLGSQSTAPAQPAVPAPTDAPDIVFGSANFNGITAQGKTGQAERVRHSVMGSSPQKGRRVRPAWVSGVQPDDRDAGVSPQPAAPVLSRSDPRPSFVFGGFTAGKAGNQNASPYCQHAQPDGKRAPQPSAGLSKDAGGWSFPAGQPAPRGSSGGPLPSPRPFSPQVPVARRADAAKEPAPRPSSHDAEPPLWKEFAGFSLGKAPATGGPQQTLQAARTLAGAFQRASLRDSDAVSLADRFADSVRVGEGASAAAKTPSAAPAGGACPTPPPAPHGAGFTFGGAPLACARHHASIVPPVDAREL